MESLWGEDGLTRFYLICGIIGAAVFIIRSVLLVMGASGGDFDGWDDGASYPGSADLSLLSVQGIMAFVMMFGLTGYAVRTGTTFHSFWSFLISAVVGLVAMWAVAFGFLMMRRLESDGSINLSSAVGEHGTVYLRIPADGVGKAQVKIGHNLRVVDAMTKDGEALQSGDRIVVTGVTDDGVLVVRKGMSNTGRN